jgi:hypothetical protein
MAEKKRRSWKKRLILLVGGLLALVVAAVATVCILYPRLCQTARTLGPEATKIQFAYILESLVHLGWCNGQDQYAGKRAELEERVAGQQGVTKEKILLARILVHLDEMDTAEAMYREMLDEEPDHPEVQAQLGQLLLRQAEVKNCAQHAIPCRYPLVRTHMSPEYAKEAHLLFEQAQAQKDTWSLEWLLHVTEMAQTSVDITTPVTDQGEAPVAVPVLAEGGVASGIRKFGLGKGALFADMDGDGLLDIVSGDQFDSVTYLRNLGDRRFEDRSEEGGITATKGTFIQVAGDIDNDGDLDLYISRNAFFGMERNVLLRNDGDGKFTDITEASGTGDEGSGFVAEFADYDLDGDLDIFVSNLSNPSRFGATMNKLYGRKSNVLYRNDGDNTFTNVTVEAGLECIDSHLGASWGDFDDDGDPDLYVSTYFGFSHLYVNQGDGTFTDRAEELGVNMPWSSFSGWFMDYDLDEDLDLFVPSHAPTEVVAKYLVTGEEPLPHFTMRLYRNDGEGNFEDVTDAAHLRVAASAMGANWGDLNNDGYPDIYLGTGGPLLDRLEPNMLFLNDRKGGYWNASFETGTSYLQKGHGVSFNDLDGDGRQELHLAMGGAWPVDDWVNLLHWNEPGEDEEPAHFVKVVLRGRESNSHGVGSRVTVRAGDHTVMREIGTGGGFGMNAYVAECGLGSAGRVDSIEVRWPGRGVQRFEKLPADVTILIEEGVDEPLILDPLISGPAFGMDRDLLAERFGLEP